MIVDIIQITLSILLIAAVLLQNQGSGLGAVFGGEGGTFRTKRGIEKKLHTSTIAISILLFGVSLANALFF